MKRCRSGVMMHLQVWGKKTPRANPERTWTSNDLQKTSGKATINGRRRSTSRVERPHDPEAAPQRPPRSGLVQLVIKATGARTLSQAPALYFRFGLLAE